MPLSTPVHRIDVHRLDHYRHTGDNVSPPIHIRPVGNSTTDSHSIQWNNVTDKSVDVGVGAVFGNERQLAPITVQEIYKDANRKMINSTPLNKHTSYTSTNKTPVSNISTSITAFHTSSSERFQSRDISIQQMQQTDKDNKVQQRQHRYIKSQQLQDNITEQRHQQDINDRNTDILKLRSIAVQKINYENNIKKQ